MVFRRKRRHFKRKRGKDHKKVKMLSKLFLSKTSTQSESFANAPASFPTDYVMAANTLTLDAIGAAINLSTLLQGAADENRVGNKVQFLRFTGNINLELVDGYTNTNVTSVPIKMRTVFMRVRQMPGVPGSHTYPVMSEVFDTSATLATQSFYSPLIVSEQTRERNYDILADEAYYISYSTTGVSDLSRHTIHAHKDYMTHVGLRPRFRGIGNSILMFYDLNVSHLPATTYDGSGNNTAATSTNVYIIVTFAEFASVGSANAIKITYMGSSQYRTLN